MRVEKGIVHNYYLMVLRLTFSSSSVDDEVQNDHTSVVLDVFKGTNLWGVLK